MNGRENKLWFPDTGKKLLTLFSFMSDSQVDSAIADDG